MKVRILGVEPISLLQLVYNSRYFTTRQRRLRQCRNRVWYGIRKISSYSYPGSEIRQNGSWCQVIFYQVFFQPYDLKKHFLKKIKCIYPAASHDLD